MKRPTIGRLGRELDEALADVRDARQVDRLLRELLTAAELSALRRRWGIVRLLHAGLSQREVARVLKCSLCNVTRGARVLRRTDSAVRERLEQVRRGDSAG